MPHAIIDCSKNFSERVDLTAFKRCVHQAMKDTGMFALHTIRVRVFIAEHYLIADKNPDNAYVHISLLIKRGRSLALRDTTGKAIFQKIKDFLADDFSKQPLALSMSLEELDAVLEYQHNNIESHINEREKNEGQQE